MKESQKKELKRILSIVEYNYFHTLKEEKESLGYEEFIDYKNSQIDKAFIEVKSKLSKTDITDVTDDHIFKLLSFSPSITKLN